MKLYLLAFLILPGITVFAQPALQDSSFTNKTEAKNAIVSGLKEGKWIEYLQVSNNGIMMADSDSATFYRLTIYRHNMPCGTVRVYTMKGLLLSETHYSKGKRDGVSKEYGSKNGNLLYEDIYNNGRHAMTKFYNENGKLQCVTTYYVNKEFKTENFDEKGK